MDGWMDGLVEDLRKLEIQRRWMVARDRQSWTRVLGETEAHCGLWWYIVSVQDTWIQSHVAYTDCGHNELQLPILAFHVTNMSW